MINSEYVVTKKKSVVVCIGANAMEKKKKSEKVWSMIQDKTFYHNSVPEKNGRP